MSQIWVPPDISAPCSEAIAPLTQCSQLGYMFLTLLSQLFGKSQDTTYQSDFGTFGTSSPGIETSIFRPQFSGIQSQPYQVTPFPPVSNPFIYQTPGELPLNPAGRPRTTEAGLGPVLKTDYSINHESKTASHGPGGSQGFSETSFYFKDTFLNDSPFNKKSYDKIDSPYDFNYNFKGFDDPDVADSKVSNVREKKKRSRAKRQTVEEFDFIIVGAGSAGCVVANRLSEVKKWKVLLIEAGPEEPDITSVPGLAPVLANSNIDWMYRTQPEELTCRAHRGQSCSWFSGKVMGGSSSINYLVYMRGNKRDYDEWAENGNEGWSYREVLPYFKKSENNRDVIAKETKFHGVDGPLNVERFEYTDRNVEMLANAFVQKGLPLVDLNGRNQIGIMTTQTTTTNGMRVSTNTAFIKPVREKRDNLVVITNAFVTKVLIEPKKKIAYGIKYFKHEDGWHEVRAKKEVILSAGALNSPRILMLSGIGPRQDLESLKIPVVKNLPVGKNLQDHACTNAMLMKLTNTSTILNMDTIIRNIKEYHYVNLKYGPLSTTGPLSITAMIRTKYAPKDKTIPDIQFHFDGRNYKEFYSDPTTYLETNILPLSYYDSINVRPILLKPESRGYLTLNKTDPIFGRPLIYPKFFTVQKDLDTLVAALKFVVKLEKTESFKRNGVKFIKEPVKGCDDHKWGSNKYFSCLFTSYTGTIYHPAGTCKMGPAYDKEAIVNPRLKVYGVNHLRVADASIMPSIVRGNTNAPVMMIGEKVSDMIKDDWEHYV